MLRIGMAFLLLAFLSLWFVHPNLTSTVGKASIDAIRGLLFGLAIGFNLWAWAAGRTARLRGNGGG